MKQKIILVLLAFGLAICLAGCDVVEEDRALARDFIEEWVRSKNMHPVDEEGNVDVGGLINLGSRVLIGSTGDDETDAVINAYEVIDTLHKADELMAEGSRNRDASKMDEAIELRPGDWTYRVARAGLALEQGDVGQAVKQIEAAQIGGQGAPPLDFLDQSIAEFEKVENRIGGKFKSDEQCFELYGGLASLYRERSTHTNSPEDRARADGALTQRDMCNTK